MFSQLTTRAVVSTIIIALIATVLWGIPLYYVERNAGQVVQAEAARSATNAAATIAILIEQDIEPYRALSDVSDYKTETFDRAYYDRMLALFRDLKKAINADFVFTEKWVSDTTAAYVLDGEDPASPTFSPLGSTDAMAAAELAAFTKRRTTASGLVHETKWGTYLTGYAPIVDQRNNEVVGIVGVDFSAAHVNALLTKIRQRTIVGWIMAIALTTIGVNRALALRGRTINTDHMTKLHSRRYLDECLRATIVESLETHLPFSFAMIDIDDFKTINDLHGHLAGDKAIERVANLLRASTRRIDTPFRYGGDEFAVVLPEANAEQARTIAERVRESRGQLTLEVNDEVFELTLSIGIAQWSPGMTPNDLIGHADRALYASKAAGKDRITIYDDSLATSANEKESST